MDELNEIKITIGETRSLLELWKLRRESDSITDDYEIQLDKLTEAIDALDLAENVIIDFANEVK